MLELIDIAHEWVPGYMLTFARLSAMMATFPLFSSSLINIRVRVSLSMILTLIISPLIKDSFPVILTMNQIYVGIIREILIGLFLGIGTSVIFNAFGMAGAFIGRQIGLAMANVLDPNSGQNLPVVSQFLMVIMVTYFFVTNAHHLFIETMFRNFMIIPLQSGTFVGSLGVQIIKTGSSTFQIALKFAIPTMLLLLIIESAVGITVRVMPQMNAFFITLPLRVGVGFFALMTSLEIFQLLFESTYETMSVFINNALYQLGGS